MAQPLSVTQALTLAKGSLEQLSATIVGEVSEFSDKPGYSAVYFTLTDKSGALPCLIWRNVFDKLDITLRKGMLLEISGVFSLYVAKGRMNFNAHTLRLAGEGDLRLKVAQLAQKLELEGLMQPARKLPLPEFPTTVAVITSPRGKAIHDVLRTLRRRYPCAEVQILGVPVEGEGAPDALIHGLQVAITADPQPEVILLVRGGGSYEDLMPFNNERLARAIAASPVPVITGIGHEPDNSIADMVSSFRASTPTAAAEKAVPVLVELRQTNERRARALAAALSHTMHRLTQRLEALQSRPVFRDSGALIRELQLGLEQTGFRLQRALPDSLAKDAQSITVWQKRLQQVGGRMLAPFCAWKQMFAAQLNTLSPLAVLARGYSVTYTKEGAVVSTLDAVDCGDMLRVRLVDGSLDCTVDAKQASVLHTTDCEVFDVPTE